MPTEIKEITDERVWQDFEKNFQPHTFLQTWEWGSAQELLGHKIYRLGIFEEGKLEGTAFIYRINARRGSFLFCPHGPSLRWKKPEQFKALVLYLRQLAEKEKASFVRFSPLAPDTNEIAKIFKTAGFLSAPVHMMHPENAWILNIDRPEEEILAGMKKRTRYSIRKAEKDGVEIKFSADLEDISRFYNLYGETARRQKFVPFSEDYIRREFEIFRKNGKALIFSGYHREKLITAAIIIFSGRMAFYHHGASIRTENSGLTASELLQYRVIQEAGRRGCQSYNFWGVAPEGVKNHPWQGLSDFKKGFGGEAENYLHARDLVLSPKYWLNYTVETVRRLKRGY